ncbi:hypothetical protein MAH1_32430 [Sessilibacter sp. MAH1]
MLITISEHLNNLPEIAFATSYILICIGSSVSFWVAISSLNIGQRLFISCHGFLTLLVIGIPLLFFASGWSISAFTNAFQVSCLLPMLSIIYSLFRHSGTKLLFWLYLLLVPAIMWAWFIGSMAVSGDWL